MLPVLIALDLFGGAGGDPLPTPAERIIRLTRSAGFTVAGHVLDPRDRLNFLVDLSALLEEGETFATVTLSVLPSSAILGLSIPTSGLYALRAVDDHLIQIWPTIAGATQESAVWSGQGALCSFEIAGTTDSAPARDWQRTVSIRVAQR